MNSTTVPTLCGMALVAMASAGASHWWSLHTLTTAGLEIPPPATSPEISAPAVPAEEESSAPLESTPAAPLAAAPATPASSEEHASKEFYEALIAEIRNLRTENRDLHDQMAETNRDLMKLEFRVDTHSESFRPLPVSEERLDTSFDFDSGVLPPRADPVILPED